MSGTHARLGPSNHRWPNCPGSVREEAPYPDIAGEAAIDGTGSHLLLELCLINGVEADAYDGQIIGVNHEDNHNGWLVGIERCERVQMCLDYIKRRVNELRTEFKLNEYRIDVQAETKSNPGVNYGREDWWGTTDITITVINKHDKLSFIEVIDYKDGRMWVNASENTQLISYIGGKMHELMCSKSKFNMCRTTIVQPKTSTPVRYDDVSPLYIYAECDKMAEAAKATDNPNAPLIPDSKGGKGYCRWCKHRENCDALNNIGTEVLKDMLTNSGDDGNALFQMVGDSKLDVTAMSDEQLSEFTDAEPVVIAMFDKARVEIKRRIDVGLDVPGYAMLPGSGSNDWNISEEELVKIFKARKLKLTDIYTRKLLSPAQVAKLKLLNAKQKELIADKYVTYKAGSKKLTRVSRAKKAEEKADSLFDNLPNLNEVTTVSFF